MLCRQCGNEKREDCFHKRPDSKSGRHSICISCKSERDLGRDRGGINRRGFSDTRLEAKYKYRQTYPDKARAGYAVRRALESGKIQKHPCRECGSMDVQAHHSDYKNPLNIEWLCQKHHNELHGVRIRG